MRIQTIRVNDELLNFLSNNNISLEYIPQKAEMVILSYKKGRSSGGDIFQSFSGIEPNVIEKLECLAKNIPEFFVLGIDCIIDKDKVYIIEINFRPQITSALIPDKGVSVDLPKIIVDKLFSQKFERVNNPLDFKKILNYINKINLSNWDKLIVKKNNAFIDLQVNEF